LRGSKRVGHGGCEALSDVAGGDPAAEVVVVEVVGVDDLAVADVPEVRGPVHERPFGGGPAAVGAFEFEHDRCDGDVGEDVWAEAGPDLVVAGD
jgi:hypothetical protein